MSTYTAHAVLVGKYWHVEVPEVQRVTQARTYSEIEETARDLVAIMLDVAPDSVDIDVQVELPQGVQDHLSEVAKAREAEAAARSHAAAELRAAAVELKESGVSLRELGKLLGVSHQRAAQLTTRARKTPAAR